MVDPYVQVQTERRNKWDERVVHIVNNFRPTTHYREQLNWQSRGEVEHGLEDVQKTERVGDLQGKGGN